MYLVHFEISANVADVIKKTCVERNYSTVK